MSQAVTESAVRHFRRLCARWLCGRVSDPLSAWSALTFRLAGCHIDVFWPPSHIICFGPAGRFNVPHEALNRIQNFPGLSNSDWLVFIGVLRADPDAEHDADSSNRLPSRSPIYFENDTDVWLLVSNDGRVIGYHPGDDAAYVVADRVLELPENGGRRIASYYRRPYVDAETEATWFGRVADDESIGKLLKDNPVGEALVRFVADECPVLRADVRVGDEILLGDHASLPLGRTFGLEDVTDLRNQGYDLIGLEVGRRLPLATHLRFGGVYCVLSRGRMLKVAEDARHLLRCPENWLAGPGVLSFGPPGADYIGLGTLVVVRCRGWCDPDGESELLTKWGLAPCGARRATD